jgi:hypothetical protein
MKDLTDLSAEVHTLMKRKGFYEKRKPIVQNYLAAISEIGEAYEARRTGKMMSKGIYESAPSEFDPEWFKLNIKDTFQDEIADVVIYLLDEAGRIQAKSIEVNPSIPHPPYWMELLMEISGRVCNAVSDYERSVTEIEAAISLCYAIARGERWDLGSGYNLDEHIEMKLRYIESRPRKHGKLF